MLVGLGGVKSGQGVTSTDVNQGNAIRTSTRRRSSSAHTAGPASTHHPASAAPPPPPPPSPEVVDAVSNLPPEVRPAFRKGDALMPDVQRMDAGTGESYNPSDPMQRLQVQVKQAYNLMQRKYAAANPVTAPVVAITSPLTSGGGGGGGGGGGSSEEPEAPPPGFWDSLSTVAKIAIVGGGLAVVGGGIYFLTRKRGGSVASSHKSAA